MAEQLAAYPGRWARLWIFEDRDEADKRAAFVRSAFGRGWNVAVRETEDGWVLFARLKPELDEDAETEREPTFQ